MRKIFSLLTAILFAGSMMATDVAVTIHASSGDYYAKTHSWVTGSNSGPAYEQVVLDEVITANLIGTGNNGKYYTDWRFYTNGSDAGSFSIDAAEGYELQSVTFTYTVSNSGALYMGDTKLTSNTAVEVSGQQAVFRCKNTNTSTNGQVRLTKIAVTYQATSGGGEEQEDTYTVAGIEALCGSNWDPADTNNDMVKQQDGTYKWEKADVTLSEGAAEFKVVKNHEWGENGVNAYPAQNYQLAIAEDGVYSVTIIFNPAAEENKISAEAVKTGGAEIEHTYTVAGSNADLFGTAWDPALEANDMDLQQDGTYKWEKADVELEAGEIELKVVKDHDWNVASYPAQNYILNIEEAGVYTITITFDPANDNAVNAVAQKAGGDDPEPPVVSSYIFDWTKGTGAQITADNTDLNANDMGTMAVGTSVVARRLGSNNIDNNAKGYKLANNDVCLEIQGTQAFAVGDTVVITGVCGGTGARAFAIAPITTVNAAVDTALTNTQENTSDILEYKVVVKEAQAGDKMRIFRMAGKTMYIHSVKVLPYQAAPQPQTKDIQVVPGAWADYKLAAWAWEGLAEGAWYPVAEKNEQMIAEVPAAADHIIIVAFETTVEEFDWNAKVAQTSNQDIDDCGVIYINNGNPTWCEPAEIVAEDYTVAGDNIALFGTSWEPTNTANDMALQEDGTYKWEKSEVTLASGSVKFKVVKDHSWDIAYPAEDYILNIAEDGEYTVTVTFNPATGTVAANAQKTGEAVVERHYLVVGQPMIANGEDWNNDADINLMTTDDGGLTYTLVVTGAQLIANEEIDYRYKIVEKGSWTEYFPNTDDDAHLSVNQDGVYTLTYQYTVATQKCVVMKQRTADLPEPTLTNGYYIIGKFAGVEDWTVAGLTEAHRFILQNETEEGAFYQLTNVPLAVGDSFKIVQVYHDLIVRTWPEGSTEGAVIDANHAGEAKTIYLSFLTTGQWYCNVEPNIYDGYYLVGNIGGVETWTPVAANRFEEAEAEGEYLLHYTLAENDRIKVGYADNGVITTWYPDGTDNEYTVDANHAGEKDIYFRPIYKAEWEEFGGYIWMSAPAVAPTAAPAEPTPERYQVKAVYAAKYEADCNFGDWGSGTAYTQEEYGKKFITNAKGYFGLEFTGKDCSEMEALHLDIWAASDISLRVVPIHGGAEVGVTVNIEGQKWNAIDIALSEFAGVTDWSDVYQIKIDNAANLTFWLNNVYFYTTQTKTVDLVDGYYLIGTMNDWEIHNITAAHLFAVNPDNDAEYKLTYTLADGDEFKVVAVANNELGAWYPQEGDNYVVDFAHAGERDIYFRPDYQGGADWYAGCIYVVPDADASPWETWFATGDTWNPETESYLDWDAENGKATVHINVDKYGQWRAQVKYHGPIAEEGKCYRVALKMRANHAINNVTIKYQDNAEMIYVADAALEANVEYVFDQTAAGLPNGNGIMVLDFGFAHSGDIIEIYDVVIEEVECPVLEPTYYLAGSMNTWNPNGEEQYLFTVNPDNENELMLNCTLAEGDIFKVVETTSNSWFPGGNEESNYVVDAAHAGDVTIYFRPDYQGGEGWHYGCIYLDVHTGTAISNTAVDAKAEKILRNGMILIVKGDKTYNVMGQIVK